MADASDEPIIAREAASLTDAHSLYRKATRIVHGVVDVGQARWPQFQWPKGALEVDEQLVRQFKSHGRFTLPLRTSTPATLVFGIVQEDASAEFFKPEPHLAVWIEHNAKQTDLRRSLIHQADEANLPTTWTRRLPGWWALTMSQRIGAFDDHDAAQAWIVARFDELDTAGLLTLSTQAVTAFEEEGNSPA